jgi:hypothetical protein
MPIELPVDHEIILVATNFFKPFFDIQYGKVGPTKKCLLADFLIYHIFKEIMIKNDLCNKKFTKKVFKNEKLFLQLPVIWLGIFEINSKRISSQMKGNFLNGFWFMNTFLMKF